MRDFIEPAANCIDIRKPCPLGVRPQHYGNTRMCKMCAHRYRRGKCAWRYDTDYYHWLFRNVLQLG